MAAPSLTATVDGAAITLYMAAGPLRDATAPNLARTLAGRSLGFTVSRCH